MPDIDLSPETLRAEFQSLTDQVAAKRSVIDPLRETRDATVAANREAEATLDAEIRAAEDGLADVENRRANISRFLNGKTGVS